MENVAERSTVETLFFSVSQQWRTLPNVPTFDFRALPELSTFFSLYKDSIFIWITQEIRNLSLIKFLKLYNLKNMLYLRCAVFMENVAEHSTLAQAVHCTSYLAQAVLCYGVSERSDFRVLPARSQ